MKFSRQLVAIAFFIIMVEILVIMLIIGAVKDKIVDGLIAEGFKQEKTLASQVAHSLQQDLLAVEDILFLLAHSPEIQSSNAATCNEKLDQVFPILNKKIGNLVRINTEGEVYCAVNRSAIGVNTLPNIDLGTILRDPEHKPVLHRITFSPISNRYVAGIHVPVYDDKGVFTGSMGGVIYFDELKEKYFKDFVLLDTGVLMVIDDNGDVLYNPNYPQIVGKNLLSEEILTQMPEREDYTQKVNEILSNTKEMRPSFMRYHYPPSPERIAAYYPVEVLPGRYWAVVITVPVEEIIDQLDEDSLIGGFKNFSALAIATITIIFVTQISLFLYLISRIPTVASKAKED